MWQMMISKRRNGEVFVDLTNEGIERFRGWQEADTIISAHAVRFTPKQLEVLDVMARIDGISNRDFDSRMIDLFTVIATKAYYVGLEAGRKTITVTEP